MTFEDGSAEGPKESPEVIRSAAVLYRDEIFMGIIHSDAIAALKLVHPLVRDDEYKNGFVTSTGRFVDRVEAGLIAEKDGQLRDSARRRWDPVKGLWTEDLKPEAISRGRGEIKGEKE